MSTYTSSPGPMTGPSITFTPAQWRALHTVRQRYQEDRDLFTRSELAHLRFLR